MWSFPGSKACFCFFYNNGIDSKIQPFDRLLHTVWMFSDELMFPIRCLHGCSEWQAVGVAHHVPDPQDDGSCADMAAQTAACGVPAVPRGDHHLVWFITTERAFRGDLGVRKRHGPRCPVCVRRASVQAEEWRPGPDCVRPVRYLSPWAA